MGFIWRLLRRRRKCCLFSTGAKLKYIFPKVNKIILERQPIKLFTIDQYLYHGTVSCIFPKLPTLFIISRLLRLFAMLLGGLNGNEIEIQILYLDRDVKRKTLNGNTLTSRISDINSPSAKLAILWFFYVFLDL